MSARIQILVLSTVPILIGLMLLAGQTHSRQFRYCALCRLVRCDYQSVAGYGWSEFEINECSEWYPMNIEASHEHVWQRSPSSAGFNRYREPIWVADSVRPGGLLLFTPKEQVAIYKHIPDSSVAKRLFIGMRNDAETEHSDRHVIVRSKAHILKEWCVANFEGPWVKVFAELVEVEDFQVGKEKSN